MGQRLIQPGRSAASQFIAQHKRIIGHTSRGPVWSVAGGADDDIGQDADDDPGSDDDADDDDDSGSDDSDDDDKDKGKKTGKHSKDDDDDGDETIAKWKYDKLHTRMQAADRRASDLQKQLDEVKNGKDVGEEVKAEIAVLKPQVEKLTGDNAQLRIKLAFFSVNNVDWEDVETALSLLDLSDVDTDDKGNVDKRALKSAIKDLAKSKPYLVKKKNDATDDDSGGTGPQMAGRRKGQRDTTSRETLAKRFPVLANK